MKRMLVLLLSLAIFCTLVPSAMAGSWTCPDCGKKNSGDYCGECGRYVHANVEREINLVRSKDWFCLNCGNISTDKFCSSCGSKRSEGMEGSFVRYGAYEQDDNVRNGDEDIEWVVVSEESDSLTLLSLYLLDAQSFDDSQSTNRWSDSSLRVWLHNSFLPKAFSGTELRYFLRNNSDWVSLMPRGMANSALIQREARIAEATTSARNRAEGWIDTNCWFIIDGGVCGYVDGDQGNLGSFCSGGETQTMYVRPMIVIRNIPAMEELYQQGLALLENEEYDDALNIFEGIRIYKDSAEKITLLENLILEKQYQYGLALLENEEYDEALKIFESIRAYKDSTQKIEDCESAILEEKYNAAVALMEQGDYKEALTIFTRLNGYGDSADYINTIEDEFTYQKAKGYLNEGVYFKDYLAHQKAYDLFSGIEKYKDSSEYLADFEKRCVHIEYLSEKSDSVPSEKFFFYDQSGAVDHYGYNNRETGEKGTFKYITEQYGNWYVNKLYYDDKSVCENYSVSYKEPQVVSNTEIHSVVLRFEDERNMSVSFEGNVLIISKKVDTWSDVFYFYEDGSSDEIIHYSAPNLDKKVTAKVTFNSFGRRDKVEYIEKTTYQNGEVVTNKYTYQYEYNDKMHCVLLKAASTSSSKYSQDTNKTYTISIDYDADGDMISYIGANSITHKYEYAMVYCPAMN